MFEATLNATAEPVAYPYGPDDNFVVEGASVTMDQFEEILAQHDPSGRKGGLIESLGSADLDRLRLQPAQRWRHLDHYLAELP